MDLLKQLLDNKTLLIGVIAAIGFIILFMIVSMLLSFKKKKTRKILLAMEKKIQQLKETDAIKNYATYDNLKNDEKLGMLVFRWKRSIEDLVKEIDALLNLTDVLEDAIDNNKYKNFFSLYQQIENDYRELLRRSEELNDEIAEYVTKASDNRKYISKYQEMFTELVSKYLSNHTLYFKSHESIDQMIDQIKTQFQTCRSHIQESRFDEADKVAAKIFDQIKLFNRHLDEIPEFYRIMHEEIEPKFNELSVLRQNFTDQELNMFDSTFRDLYQSYLQTKAKMYQDLIQLETDHFKDQLNNLNHFLDHYLQLLNRELANKKYIEENIKYQKEYLKKVENTAKNFISIFRMINKSYNERDVESIEEIIIEIEKLKAKLHELEELFEQKEVHFGRIKGELEISHQVLTRISNYLDDHISIIDEIYSDEKEAREKIHQITEKINGTKKFIKYANLIDQEKDLLTIKQLNTNLSKIYQLFSDFPLDIVAINDLINEMTQNVDRVTKDINNKIYKALLIEHALIYANRYYANPKYRPIILQAEQLFFKQDLVKANEVIMNMFDQIDPQIKRVIYDQFQMKFNALFNNASSNA